jgi:phosphate transport system substrate-binding protein
MPADFRVSITNAEGKGVYPISSFTWLLLYENPKDKSQSKVMVDFVKWALGDGQKFAPELGYAPLPAEVVKQEMDALGKIKLS